MDINQFSIKPDAGVYNQLTSEKRIFQQLIPKTKKWTLLLKMSFIHIVAATGEAVWALWVVYEKV